MEREIFVVVMSVDFKIICYTIYPLIIRNSHNSCGNVSFYYACGACIDKDDKVSIIKIPHSYVESNIVWID